MVYVVERYLPGLVPSELERMLDRLDRAAEGLVREGLAVRHLGSTIVPGDEACYCQFEAPSRRLSRSESARACAVRPDRDSRLAPAGVHSAAARR